VDDSTRGHVCLVANCIYDETLVPFLGAGVNLMSRPTGESFSPGSTLPSGSELAAYLAKRFGYPRSDFDLMRISQFATLAGGPGSLYDRLHALFDADYPITPLHRLLAQVPEFRRGRGKPGGFVVFTTNYDDTLERAFLAAEEPFDLLYYIAEGRDSGHFAHVQDGKSVVIRRSNQYSGLRLEERPVIVKIHGAVKRGRKDEDSYVITEDDYLDYVTPEHTSQGIPVFLLDWLKQAHVLFLGYGLADWNTRVIFRRVLASQKRSYAWWAVQLDADPLDRRWWDKHGIEVINCPLDEYVAALEQALHEVPVEGLA
jgi:hypothetical protein